MIRRRSRSPRKRIGNRVWASNGSDFQFVAIGERLITVVADPSDFQISPTHRDTATVLRCIGQCIVAPGNGPPSNVNDSNSVVAMWSFLNLDDVGEPIDPGDLSPATEGYYDTDYFGYELRGQYAQAPLAQSEEEQVIAHYTGPHMHISWDLQIRRRMTSQQALCILVMPMSSWSDAELLSVAVHGRALLQTI